MGGTTGRAETPGSDLAGSSLWPLPGMRSLVYLGMLAFTSFFLTLSALPLYAISIGTDKGAAGVVTTVMLATTVATQTLVPAMVKRFGLVAVLAAGLVLLGAPAPLYLIGRHLGGVLVISGVRGMGFAILTVLMPLVASRLVPPARRGGAIGLYGLAIAIPNLAGVPGGVALTGAGHFSWVAVASASPLLALPLLGRIGRSVRSVGHDLPAEGSTSALAHSGRALRSIAGVTVVLLVVTLSGGGVLTFLPVASTSGTLATVALLVFGATGALSRWRAGILADRVGSRKLLPAAVLVGSAGMALIAGGLAFPTSALVLTGAAVLGLGYGSVQNVSLLVAFDRAGPRNQAVASAAWNAAFDSGTAIGALVVGVAATAGPGGGVGFGWSFAGCAILIALTVPLAVGSTRLPADGRSRL